VPDFYQGTELWDFSLVDPDNRRPVDFSKRVKLLDDLIQQEVQGQNLLVKRILKSWQDGRVKLYVTYKALDIRRADKDVFQDGSYVPLQVEGQRQEHVCAFGRHKDGVWVLAVVPRLLTKLVRVGNIPVGREVWRDDVLLLPKGTPDHWLNIFTGEVLKVSITGKRLSLSEILGIFPVALLICA
jgi:(1->4)-alpha-D-glucan 1-alpha-D-glucosylmutase